MGTHFSASDVERMRRQAKALKRELGIELNAAQDQIAKRHGFQNWSILVKNSDKPVLKVVAQAIAQPPDRPQPIRRYIHGDVSETDPQKCFCARCDYMVDLDHFQVDKYHRDDTNGGRYLTSLQRWDAMPPSRRRLQYRPKDAVNILELPTALARQAYEASRGPFHRWLERQRARDDIIGDLASDVFRDRGFPVQATSLDEAREHLEGRFASDGVLEALTASWKEFSRA